MGSEVQSDITESMRGRVVDWTLEVCEEQGCSIQVFLLATNYLDRFLSKVKVRRSQLQLFSSACLLLSSKFLEARPLYLHQLIVYTDCSVTSQELQDAEMLVLVNLGWELATPTPLDFLYLLLARLDGLLSRSMIKIVKKNCSNYFKQWAHNYHFYTTRPSILAGSAIWASLRGLSIINYSSLMTVIFRALQSDEVHIEQITSDPEV